jgi:hypothetical protein
LQLRVLCLGLLQDGDVGVGVFPEGEEVLICRLGFGGVALQGVGATDLEMRECSDEFVYYNPTMVENLLKLGSGFAALRGLSLRQPDPAQKVCITRVGVEGLEGRINRNERYIGIALFKAFLKPDERIVLLT